MIESSTFCQQEINLKNSIQHNCFPRIFQACQVVLKYGKRDINIAVMPETCCNYYWRNPNEKLKPSVFPR